VICNRRMAITFSEPLSESCFGTFPERPPAAAPPIDARAITLSAAWMAMTKRSPHFPVLRWLQPLERLWHCP